MSAQTRITTHTATLDGHSIEYCSDTEFKVQVASPRGKYQTRYSIRGNLGQAVLYYNGINLGYGWRKRLFVPGFNKPVIAKAVS